MQIKTQYSTAGDDQMSGRRKLRHEVAEFIDNADDAAVALYTLSCICTSLFASGRIQRELASKIMAVSGTMSILSSLLSLTPEISLLYPDDLELLSNSIDTCKHILHKIMTAVRTLDDSLADESLPEGSKAPAKFNAFDKGEDVGPLRILDDCFHVVTRLIVTASAVYLTRRDILTDSESSEALRLQRALSQNEIFQAPPTDQSLFTYLEGAPRSINILPLSAPSTLFRTQPPSPPRQHQPQPISFSAFQQTSHVMPEPLSKDQMASTTHLEAYILCPQVHSINNSSIMVYHTDPLHLEEGDVRAHTYKHSLEHPIVDAVCELLPDQLRIIQERTIARQGHLVSVKHGAEVDIVTQMGTFKVKSVIFIVKTAAEKEKQDNKNGVADQVGFQKSCWMPKPEPPASTAFGTRPSPFGVNAPSPVASGTTSATPGFITDAPLRTGLELRNEPGFFREKDGSSTTATQDYMTITSSERYRDKSVEELRLADYKAGRTNIDASASKIWPHQLSMDSRAYVPLESGSTNPKVNEPVGLFGQNSNWPLGSAFLQTGNDMRNNNEASCLFGQKSSTATSDLFAKPSTASESFFDQEAIAASSLFGQQNRKSSEGWVPSKNGPFGYASDTGTSNLFSKWFPIPKPTPASRIPPAEAFDKSATSTELAPLSPPKTEEQRAAECKEKAQRKQKMKEQDFDPNHESEEEWSARYDRLEGYRIADAKKPPKVPDTIYTVDTNGVARVKMQERPAPVGPNIFEGFRSNGTSSMPLAGVGKTSGDDFSPLSHGS